MGDCIRYKENDYIQIECELEMGIIQIVEKNWYLDEKQMYWLWDSKEMLCMWTRILLQRQ